jgi:pimeloyl-ACP methyl ester carboxylesterase
MSVIADGLAAILEAEGVSQAHVFGHSLGAAVGHVLVRLCPERVDKLVLDGFGLYTPGHVRFAKLFFKLPFGLLMAYYRRTINRLMAGADDPEILFWKAYLEELLTRLHSRETLTAQFRLLIDIFDHAAEYGVFHMVEKPGRVLLILAKDDRGFTPAEREALIESYPGAQVHWFVRGGHLSGFTRREEFNDVLDGFLLGATDREKSILEPGS